MPVADTVAFMYAVSPEIEGGSGNVDNDHFISASQVSR